MKHSGSTTCATAMRCPRLRKSCKQSSLPICARSMPSKPNCDDRIRAYDCSAAHTEKPNVGLLGGESNGSSAYKYMLEAWLKIGPMTQ